MAHLKISITGCNTKGQLLKHLEKICEYVERDYNGKPQQMNSNNYDNLRGIGNIKINFPYSFSDALEAIDNGSMAKRSAEPMSGMVLIRYKDTICQMNRETGVRSEFIPSQEDLLSNDWVVIEVE